MTSTSLSSTMMTHEVFKGLCESLGRAGFLSRYPNPFLLLTHRTESGDMQGFGFHTAVTPISGAALGATGPAFIAPIAKRDVNKFATMITVGRAINNDLRLDLPSISKFHAYFMTVSHSGVWYLLDANSSNGTFVNGVRLTADRNRVVVNSGDKIRFGADVDAVFFDPAAIYDLIRP